MTHLAIDLVKVGPSERNPNLNMDAQIWPLHHKLSEDIVYAATRCVLNKEGVLLERFVAEVVVFCSGNFQAQILSKREANRLNGIPFASLELVYEALWSINEILRDAKVLATSDLMRRSH